jgi:hypothetical protein
MEQLHRPLQIVSQLRKLRCCLCSFDRQQKQKELLSNKPNSWRLWCTLLETETLTALPYLHNYTKTNYYLLGLIQLPLQADGSALNWKSSNQNSVMRISYYSGIKNLREIHLMMFERICTEKMYHLHTCIVPISEIWSTENVSVRIRYLPHRTFLRQRAAADIPCLPLRCSKG